jgi:type I restriction enzyme, S subunit
MENSLPKGWIEIALEECCDILDNIRIPVNSDERSRRQGHVPYYGATGQVGWIDNFLFDEELVLIGEDGAPFYDKSKNIAYVITGKSWVNNHAHVLRAKEVTTNKFVNYFLNNFNYNGYVNGTTRLKLTQGKLKEIPLLLPPLKEQQRIVEKLDALMARINNSKARLENIPALLKNFRQSVLAAAVSGELTNEWRAINKVSNDWKDVSLVSLCDTDRGISYGVIKLGEYVENGVPCLRTSDVKPLFIDTSSVKRISKEISDNYKRTILKGGEILVNVRGTLGGVAVVPDILQGWNISREVAIAPIIRANPYYVAFHIASTDSQNWLTDVSKGVAYTGINLEDLRNLPIRLPLPEEQKEIVRKVEELFHFADRIEARYQKAKAWFDKLPQSLLAKTFRGELVPQNEEDEPAEILLEKIKALKIEQEIDKEKKVTKKGDRTKIRVTTTKISSYMNLIEIIRNSFKEDFFTYEELDKILSHKSKLDYVETKKQFFNLLRNEKFKRKETKLVSELDKSGVMKYKLV